MRVRVSSCQNIFFRFVLPLTHCISMLVFLQGGMDYGSTLDLKLARFLREACAELG